MDPNQPNASYGALISIVLILAIVVVGAFYVWGKRVSEQGKVIELPPMTSTTTEEGGLNLTASTTASTTP